MKLTSARLAVVLAFAPLVPSSFAQYAGVERHRKHEQHIDPRIARLDTFDFHALSHHNWSALTRSHANNVVVHWPDGRRTKGLERHIEELKSIFLYAPDTRMRSTPVRFASRDWTCVMGELEGTFAKSMPAADGSEIPPTRKHFKITVCAVGHWNSRGLMDEEYLFWDYKSIMRQVGVTK
jgi:hypothetical protein